MSAADQILPVRGCLRSGVGALRLLSLAFNTNVGSPAANLILGDHTTDYTALDAGAFGSSKAATFLVLTFQVAHKRQHRRGLADGTFFGDGHRRHLHG